MERLAQQCELGSEDSAQQCSPTSAHASGLTRTAVPQPLPAGLHVPAQATWYSAEEADTLVPPTQTRLRSIHSKQVRTCGFAWSASALEYPRHLQEAACSRPECVGIGQHLGKEWLTVILVLCVCRPL
jgi:hypothetical protein